MARSPRPAGIPASTLGRSRASSRLNLALLASRLSIRSAVYLTAASRALVPSRMALRPCGDMTLSTSSSAAPVLRFAAFAMNAGNHLLKPLASISWPWASRAADIWPAVSMPASSASRASAAPPTAPRPSIFPAPREVRAPIPAPRPRPMKPPAPIPESMVSVEASTLPRAASSSVARAPTPAPTTEWPAPVAMACRSARF